MAKIDFFLNRFESAFRRIHSHVASRLAYSIIDDYNIASHSLSLITISLSIVIM